MKRRYMRVVFDRGATPSTSHIYLAESGRDISANVPVGIWPTLATARIGDKVRTSLFVRPLRTRRTPSKRGYRLVRQPAVLRFAEIREVPA